MRVQDRPVVCGVVLAGGCSRRMGGGDKCLLPLGGRPLLAHVIDRFAPQVAALALSANGDPARFASFDLPVLEDVVGGSVGPLAGIHAGMRWARRQSATRLVATVPGDAPFVPRDVVARLYANLGESGIAIVRSRGRTHPVVGLWDASLADDLGRWLGDGGSRNVEAWARDHGCVFVDFMDGESEAFFNVNTPEDLVSASRHHSVG